MTDLSLTEIMMIIELFIIFVLVIWNRNLQFINEVLKNDGEQLRRRSNKKSNEARKYRRMIESDDFFEF